MNAQDEVSAMLCTRRISRASAEELVGVLLRRFRIKCYYLCLRIKKLLHRGNSDKLFKALVTDLLYTVQNVQFERKDTLTPIQSICYPAKYSTVKCLRTGYNFQVPQ